MTSLHIRAEAATLGAILHEPKLFDELRDRLSSDVWERPRHAQVWEAMMRLRALRQALTPQAVAAELVRDPDISDQGAAYVCVADLMEAAPRPAHAASYARMVGDAARRRTLMGIGRRLAQAATSGDAAETVAQAAEARQALTPVREAHYGPPPRPVPVQTSEEERREQVASLLARADEVRTRAATAAEPERSGLLAELADMMRRIAAYVMEMQWRPLPANPDQQHVGARALAARAAQRRHADRQAEEQAAAEGVDEPASEAETPTRSFENGALPEDPPTGAVAEVEQAREAAERQLLAAIAADPETALAAVEGLDRDAWADTWRRDIATLAAGLHDAGEPVDALTLEWAARQAGLVADEPTGEQIPAAELADALRTPYLDAGAHAKDISEAATRIAVAEAAEQVLATADDPTVEVTASMDRLDLALARVAPDQPQTVAEPVTSADPVDEPDAAPSPESWTPANTTTEAQPAPAVTAAPTVPVDTTPQASQPHSPRPAASVEDGPVKARTDAASEAYPSLHATPGDEEAHVITLSAETRAVADRVFARLDAADGAAIPITPTEHAAVLEVRGYSPEVAREAAERAEIDAQHRREIITYRATRPVPTRPDAAESVTSEDRDSVTPEVTDSGSSRPAQPSGDASAPRRIDPAAPVEQLAQDVVDRITRRHGVGAVDPKQVERVLTEHYHVSTDKAGAVAGRAVQLDAARRGQASRTSEVRKSVTPEVRESDTSPQRTREREAEHEQRERRQEEQDRAAQRDQEQQRERAQRPAAVGR